MLSWAEFRGAVLTLGALIVAVFAVIILQPGLPGELLLQSLRFHILVLGLVLAILAVLLGALWRGFALLLVAVLVGLDSASYVLEFQSRRTEYKAEPTAQFRFVSFNVLTGNARAQDLVDTILADPPDVLLVMETPGIESQLGQLAEVLPHRLGCDVSESCDISLHSRWPFVAGSVRNLRPFDRERLVHGRIEVGGELVDIVGVHLSKPYFDHAQFQEVSEIRWLLSGLDEQLVLAGDFNSAYWAEPVAALMRDQALVPGPWPVATWPVRFGRLGVPIDNVFTRGSVQLMTLEAGESLGSNHRPLYATVGLYPAD